MLALASPLPFVFSASACSLETDFLLICLSALPTFFFGFVQNHQLSNYLPLLYVRTCNHGCINCESDHSEKTHILLSLLKLLEFQRGFSSLRSTFLELVSAIRNNITLRCENSWRTVLVLYQRHIYAHLVFELLNGLCIFLALGRMIMYKSQERIV